MADLSITDTYSRNIKATPTAENLITTHLDIWTTAIEQKSSAGRGSSNKFSLYGIKKLRELILELAVRGKLVPQASREARNSANYEPASVLLERIAAEKAQLVKEGKLKKQKPFPEISEDEKLFELPNGWEWGRIGTVFKSIMSGGTPSKRESSYWGGDIPWASVKDLGSSRSISTTQDFISRAGLDNGSKLADIGDLLICTRMGLGKIAVVKKPLAFNQDLKAVTLSTHINIEFFINYYSTIKIEGTGTTVAGITQDQLLNYVAAIPPLEEQHRIVAKVDELMSLCDALEAQTEASIAAHQTLVETLLNALLLPQTAANTASQSDISLERPFTNSFVKDWQRVAEHFDTLFTTSASIDTLKQTILQLAVMGKLVKQDPNDEPAAKLLARIAKEKAQLFKEGKIKKQKPLPAITDEEKQFELPSGWAYERIGTFGIVGTGSTPSRSNPLYWEPAEINWVSSGETSNFFVTQTKERVSELAIKETNVSIYPAGTLIVAMYGQGKTRGQITELLEPAGTNQACAAIRLVDESVNHKDYVKLFFRKAYLELREHAAGGAQPNLNVGKIASTIVPLPPLEEQHRIVAKVEELMALCDQLKVRLADAQTTQLHLTDAIVEQAV
ncbi:type I restriction endonuclease EcoAI subunit S [Shewanella hafniensis]|uniref:restriction endonuclease subunit S n=1 Tax=Shewanella TaxID=22 RepID=UPI001BB8345C|nr:MULTISPECIES: restriction endonuclease subunit S [Shewanella]MCB2382185.1 restriction endonuclease subunit S [Shewanella sp. SR1]MCL1134118.1 restriction endonuclease subunit S [Shewanella hafniensis]MCS6205465.1 restriction endonuclease subunit S [Shewanella baltica]MCU7985672.1 restriction endonuclease subunit S [Shewanella sp. SW24]GIU37760.1 type I restriction endonuclease EcoAI subunit S [Shewanella hafniensis]